LFYLENALHSYENKTVRVEGHGKRLRSAEKVDS